MDLILVKDRDDAARVLLLGGALAGVGTALLAATNNPGTKWLGSALATIALFPTASGAIGLAIEK
jgi:hypothetical protein